MCIGLHCARVELRLRGETISVEAAAGEREADGWVLPQRSHGNSNVSEHIGDDHNSFCLVTRVTLTKLRFFAVQFM